MNFLISLLVAMAIYQRGGKSSLTTNRVAIDGPEDEDRRVLNLNIISKYDIGHQGF